jgi:hypothetical protein
LDKKASSKDIPNRLKTDRHKEKINPQIPPFLIWNFHLSLIKMI